MLQTGHEREFYLARAKEYPLLEDIVAGKATFTETLGEFLASVQAGEDNALEGLEGYLALLGEFRQCLAYHDLSMGCRAVEEYRSWCLGGTNFSKNSKKANKIGFTSLAIILGGGILGMIGIPAGAALVVAGLSCAAEVEEKSVRKTKEALSCIGETLRPFCEQLDLSVLTAFAASYFTNAREYSEQMYPELSDGQRQQVNTQLYALLEAGGMPGMDEQDFRDYLGGLLDRGRDDNA